MIMELEKVLEDVKPGSRRKSWHIRVVAKALKAIMNIQAGTGIKITRGEGKIHIEQA